MIHLGIIEDESYMLESIEDSFERSPNIEVTLTAQSVEYFLENLYPEVKLDVLFLDINLPGRSGIEGIAMIKEKRPEVDIIMLTSNDNSDSIFKALCAGAVSYILKQKVNPNILRDAVTIVSRGGAYMTPGVARRVVTHFTPAVKEKKEILTQRQSEIVDLLTKGYTYKAIAAELFISIETVRDHIKKIYRTLQVNSKTEVIRKKLRGEI